MKITDRRLWQAVNIEDWEFRRNLNEDENQLLKRERMRTARPIGVQAFVTPNPGYVLGMDASHWDGGLDFTHTYERGMRFVFFKCVDGTVATRWWDVNRPAALAAGLIVGDYAWLYPSFIVSCRLQAAAYWARLASVPMQLPAVIDFEWTSYNGQAANPTYNDLDIWVTEFSRLSGYKPILYSAAGFMNQLGTMPAALRDKFAALWIANYAVSSPLLPYGFTRWDFWQFTDFLDQTYYAPSSLNKRELDGNYWKLDLQALRTFAGIGGDMVYVWKKATGNITMRTGPGTTYPNAQLNGVNDYVLNGDVVEVSEIVNGFAHISRLFRNNVQEQIPAVAWAGTAYLVDTPAPTLPPTTPTLPDLPVTMILGDDVTYIKQTITTVLKPK
jgi:GH25 family lysozyme M1 (1,4-beta-N-acetylmuramidase)